jgi:hypothetical protein
MPSKVSELYPDATAPVSPRPGNMGFWSLAVEPVAEGSINLLSMGAIQLGPLEDTAAPTTRQAIMHAYYLISGFVKVAGVYVQIGGAMFDPPGIFPRDVYMSTVREYNPGPPATIRTWLRVRNMTPVSQTIFYRVYKWRGLR